MIFNNEISKAVDLFEYLKIALKNNDKVVGFDSKFETYKDFEKHLLFQANAKFSYSLLTIVRKVNKACLRLVNKCLIFRLNR